VIEKKLSGLHKQYANKLMRSLAKESDPDATQQVVKAAREASDKMAKFIKKVKLEQAQGFLLHQKLTGATSKVSVRERELQAETETDQCQHGCLVNVCIESECKQAQHSRHNA
jgi:hypothetical protein